VFLITKRLEHLGCTVTAFTDPLAAVREFIQRPDDFDVVVTDVSMPHMSGFELASEPIAVRPEIPIIVISGYVRTEDRAKAEELGIREIVSKPSRITDLTDAMERVCIVRPTTEPITP
jgi:CheY-like chemotaxis protein